jgi:hypothetical protein
MDNETAVIDNQWLQSSKDKPMHFVQGNDDEFVVSEPMRIQVTIYSLEGIRQHKVANPQHTVQNRYFAKKNSSKSTITAPITALISVRGEVIKTIVPSVPLNFHPIRQEEKSVRGMAFWQDAISNDAFKSKDEVPPSTFELLRNMKRQCFHPTARIGQVSHYYPVRVDLVIGVGRGTNICPLGISSAVVSGEEEGEYLTNIPIKSLAVKNEKKNGKVRRHIASYFDGESHMYTLDSNAILRVGIRVIPRHNYIPNTMTKVSSQEIPNNENDENVFIELNDENSLIAQFKESEQNDLHNNGDVQQNHPFDSRYSLFFCGAMSCLPSQPSDENTHSESKISEAKVLSIRAMSDVSGSTMRWQSRHETKYEL